jgi:hypothetical protein
MHASMAGWCGPLEERACMHDRGCGCMHMQRGDVLPVFIVQLALPFQHIICPLILQIACI